MIKAPVERIRPRRVVFAVEDQGCGIPPEVAEQLFTPFFTTKHEGMGLGLSMCRTVLEQHGGELRSKPMPLAARCLPSACRWLNLRKVKLRSWNL